MTNKFTLAFILLCFSALFSFKAVGQLKPVIAKSTDELYPWEQERQGLLDSRDMVLLYGGGSHRNYAWDDARIAPYVTYVDKEGNENWLFDNYLMLEIYDGDRASYGYGYKDTPANQADWKRLVDYFFQQNIALGALNKAVKNATYRIGQPKTKRKITIGIPEPIKSLTNWGSVKTGQILNFANDADRIQACIWYIDYVRQKFSEANFDYLELSGFYWIAETTIRTEAIVPTVGMYLNALKYGFNWIPFFEATDSKRWKELKFNFAYLQPNYFFKEPLITDRLEKACSTAVANNMDMELEFDERILTKQNAWHNRLENYMEAFKRYGIWENKRIAYYQGGRALYELSVSADAVDNAMYHKFCQFVVGRSPSQKVAVDTNWSFSNAANPSNSPNLPGTQTPLMPVNSSTRNFAVGKMNGEDRVFLFTREGDKKAKVLVYDATNGSYVKSLNTGNVVAAINVGNILPIGGGGLTVDGKLLLSNVVGPSGSSDYFNFKIYAWDDENQAQPEVVINYYTRTKYPTGRFGDKLTITGSYSDGTARIYATNKIVGYSNILCWKMISDNTNPGKFVFNQTPEELFPVLGKSIQSSICPNNDGEFYYKESERPLIKYNHLGDSIGVSATNTIRDWGTSLSFVGKDGNDDILAYFKYRSKATNPVEPVQERVDLLRVRGGNLATAEIIASTPTLGAEYNLNGWCDVVARKSNNDVEIFALSASNGFGKFTVKDVFSITSTTPVSNATMRCKQFPDRIMIEDIQLRSISMYSITGQLIRTQYYQNFIETNQLKGFYILNIQSVDGKKQAIKVLI